MARTFLVTLHYDGSGFAGWQRQAEGRTVQAVVEAALERLAGLAVRAHAAGRTDAGVHAVGMAVSCIMPERWSPAELHRALNALLPCDCWAESVQEMRPGFHARTSATGRRYRYLIGTDPAASSPFRRRYEWALGRPLDGDALEAAADAILAEHDFHAFSVRSSPRAHKRCRIRAARWSTRPEGLGLRFEIAADRFLHHMVRNVVGSAVEVGRGARSVGWLAETLASRDRTRAGPTAPAHGLVLVRVRYPG